VKSKSYLKILLLPLSIFVCGISSAQTFPEKTIRFIVPSPVGGGTNLVARVIAQKMSENYGQQVFVDNRGGPGGIIATKLTVESPADGHTILLGLPASITVPPALFKNLQYHPLKDLAPIGLVGTSAYILSVHPSLPAKSVKELIALAKANPGKINFSSGGSGAGNHLSAELFKSMSNINLVHVPYRGGGPALIAVLTGEAQVIFGSMLSVIPQMQAKRIRAIAVTSATRTSALPELPTIAEAGVPGYEVDVWFGVFAPKGTPQNIIKILNQELFKILNDSGVKAKLSVEGFEARTSTTEDFSKMLHIETKKWADVVAKSGAKLD